MAGDGYSVDSAGIENVVALRAAGFNPSRKRLSRSLSRSRQHNLMECERWLHSRIDALKMRSVFEQQQDVGYASLPEKLERRLMQFDKNERNMRGETMIISVVRYVTERQTQIRYLNMLVRAGCDVSTPDLRHQRTPIMFACLAQNEEVAQLLIHCKADLTMSDRLGNTALMYAALYGHVMIVGMLVNELTRSWSFDVFRARNIMGHTAEALARRNGRYECSRLLKRERLQMLQRMHKQLALIHLSASLKGWHGYSTVYKAKQAFLNGKFGSEKKKKKNQTMVDDHSNGMLRAQRVSRSIGENDFKELLRLPRLPPVKVLESSYYSSLHASSLSLSTHF